MRRGFRRFHLVRDEDETGISGTGIVAEGIQFSDGRCVLRWTTTTSSTGYYDTILHVEHLHGHNGKTRVVWVDEE